MPENQGSIPISAKFFELRYTNSYLGLRFFQQRPTLCSLRWRTSAGWRECRRTLRSKQLNRRLGLRRPQFLSAGQSQDAMSSSRSGDVLSFTRNKNPSLPNGTILFWFRQDAWNHLNECKRCILFLPTPQYRFEERTSPKVKMLRSRLSRRLDFGQHILFRITRTTLSRILSFWCRVRCWQSESKVLKHHSQNGIPRSRSRLSLGERRCILAVLSIQQNLLVVLLL